jgi:osmoprotectant transport system permease protein
VRPGRRRTAWVMLALAAAAALLAWPEAARLTLAGLGRRGQEAFSAARLADLALSHIVIALLALLPAALIGIGCGILVTRPAGRALRPVADALVAASQAVPPVVVVALAFPALGFGAAPTVLALIIYCIMPILRGTAAAFDAASADVAEAARAMGLTPLQVLGQVEWPLALPVIAEAVRVALILAIATAAVGALAGASTLGTPIIIGLQNQNEVYIVQGAAATGALAFLADGLLLLALGALHARSAPLAESPRSPE